MTFSTDSLACLSDLTDISAWVDALGAPPAANSNVDGAETPPAQDRPQRLASAQERAVGAAALAGECARVANAPPGARNDTLNRAAFSIGTAVGAGWISEADARAGLVQAAMDCGSMQDNPREVHLTINSGLPDGIARPRDPLPTEGHRDNVVPIRPEVPPTPAAVDAAFDDLVWDDEAAQDTSVEWLVKGLIPCQGVGLMPGQSTVGKSFAAMDLAGAVATGLPWFGRKTRMRGGTLLLVGEAKSTVRPRMKALREKLRPMSSDPESGEVHFRVDKLPIVWGEVANLTKATALAKAEAMVRKVSAEMQSRFCLPLRLVLVDTALAAFLFPEDPDASQVQLAINGMKRLAEACDGFAMATHHHGKSVEAGAVGSFMWRGAVDIELSVTGKKLANGDVKDRKITLEKNRHGPTAEVGGFELVKIEVGRDEDGDPVMGAYITPQGPAAERTSTPDTGGLSSRATRVFAECVQSALASHGLEGCPYGLGGDLVRAVAVDEVRTLFRVKYAPGGPPERHADTIRKAFTRALSAGQRDGRLRTREVDGVTMVWEAAFMTTAERHAAQGLDPLQTAA